MEKYIDAHKLLVEIDRQKIGYNTDGEHAAEYNTCRKILDIIDSLQQEQQEIDLEDEMEKFGERWPYPASFDGYDKDWVDELTEECAKHFYELGKNSK